MLLARSTEKEERKYTGKERKERKIYRSEREKERYTGQKERKKDNIYRSERKKEIDLRIVSEQCIGVVCVGPDHGDLAAGRRCRQRQHVPPYRWNERMVDVCMCEGGSVSVGVGGSGSGSGSGIASVCERE